MSKNNYVCMKCDENRKNQAIKNSWLYTEFPFKNRLRDRLKKRLLQRVVFCEGCGVEHWYTQDSLGFVNPKYLYPVVNGSVKCPLEGL